MTANKVHPGRSWSTGLVIVLTIGLLLPSGCTSWRTQSKPVDEVLSAQRPTCARLILEDWSMVVVQRPWVSGDTLWGYSGGKPSGPSVHRVVGADGRVGYPVGEVRAVQLAGTDMGASVAALVGFIVIGTIAGAVGLTIFQGND